MTRNPAHSSSEAVGRSPSSTRDDLETPSVLGLFWGLILAKLFLLEFGVQRYEVPINSAIFLWALTLIMGGLCTGVFLLMRRRLSGRAILANRALRLWSSASILAAIVSAVGLTVEAVDPYLVPGFLAVIAGVVFFLHGREQPTLRFRFIAIAWLAGALWLLLDPVPAALARFSLLLLALMVLPAGWIYYEELRLRRRHT